MEAVPDQQQGLILGSTEGRPRDVPAPQGTISLWLPWFPHTENSPFKSFYCYSVFPLGALGLSL